MTEKHTHTGELTIDRAQGTEHCDDCDPVLGDLMDAESVIDGGRCPFVAKVMFYCMELLNKDDPLYVIGHIESECRDYEKLIRTATQTASSRPGPFLRGQYNQDDALQILRNVGIDTKCGACMEIAFTGVTMAAHDCTVLYQNPPAMCKGCGAALVAENKRIADGCPCNSPRGINHGLVPKNTCTCVICDPAQTGGTRYPPVVTFG